MKLKYYDYLKLYKYIYSLISQAKGSANRFKFLLLFCKKYKLFHFLTGIFFFIILIICMIIHS